MTNSTAMTEHSTINCHTHIFTAGHVPPLLAKTYIPGPFYYLMHLSAVVTLFRFWYRYSARIPYTLGFKKLAKALALTRAFFLRLYLKFHPPNELPLFAGKK